ncbi:accessory gene regulator B family protein [Clostridium sp. E02]|uniref:accessory gene regulator B family protein n=1 Tax=Clostridium sp. E02 TaxID=2487134 RepID=UPI000F54751C|nr:accessory gene regulator B family protein [Clostridium sp. E02]
MIQRLSQHIVSWQIEKNILSNEQRPLYLYAYEVLINQLVNVLIAVIIAIVLKAPIPVFVFLISYIPLRSYCGGYHARTNGGCTVVSALLVLVVCLLEHYITGGLALYLPPVGVAISGVLIYFFAPAPDKNKPLDEAETIRYRKKSRQIWLIETVILGGLYYVYPRVSVVIAISHILLSLMLVYGVFKNHNE